MNAEDYDRFERKITWIFGTPRSGSTWLAREILKRKETATWNEPLIGAHLGVLRQHVMWYYNIIAKNFDEPILERVVDTQPDKGHLFFSPTYEKVWSSSLKRLIIDRMCAQFNVEKFHTIIVKAPNESHAADIIMKCMPNSKLIFLLRDGRDVIDSRQGKAKNPIDRSNTPDEIRYKIVYYGTLWNMHTTITEKAYNAHNPDLRLLVKYEDLRFNPVPEISRIYRFLGINVSDDEILRTAEDTKWENVPEEKKGEDKNKRIASPGNWRKTFSKKEIELMNKIMGENLKRFGYQML
jgi:hypothetical protein